MKAKIGGDDVASVEEAKISPITGSVNEIDDYVREFYAYTCSGYNVYDILDNQDGIIIEDSIIWVKNNKTIWEVRVIKAPYSDLPQDYNYLKLILINKKKEDRVLIKICSREYKQKIMPISTHKYKGGKVMEKLVLDITIKIQNQKKRIITTKVKDFVRTFVVN